MALSSSTETRSSIVLCLYQHINQWNFQKILHESQNIVEDICLTSLEQRISLPLPEEHHTRGHLLYGGLNLPSEHQSHIVSNLP